MFERFKRAEDDRGRGTVVADDSDRRSTTTDEAAERDRSRDGEPTRSRDDVRDTNRTDDARNTRGAPAGTRPGESDNGSDTAVHDHSRRDRFAGDDLRAMRARQRDEFGGINWGGAFFGWLVAVGLGALLVAFLAAAGAATGLTEADVTAEADSLGIGGAIALLVALAIAYFCGGYVAGRMSRFDGGRQGIGAWVIGLAVTIVLAAVGAVLGSEYNLLEDLSLPALPVGDSELVTGGAIALVAVLVVTFLAAMAGGKAGERYHRRVDRAGLVD
jgi:hypothetical protein